jgi:hypothetical protein
MPGMRSMPYVFETWGLARSLIAAPHGDDGVARRSPMANTATFDSPIEITFRLNAKLLPVRIDVRND